MLIKNLKHKRKEIEINIHPLFQFLFSRRKSHAAETLRSQFFLHLLNLFSLHFSNLELDFVGSEGFLLDLEGGLEALALRSRCFGENDERSGLQDVKLDSLKLE
ncbi:unnamed protein product [Vicia faba]|uniref:Uncharacterized protein n=1 Tax=Vicia faba TaxID=3906 RepID=A0AAV0ZUP0_VICFA|nr:unnamed protein product [Vicia faba]